MSEPNKPCPDCGREIQHVRTLTSPIFRYGRHEVWTHTDTGYASCIVDKDGREIKPKIKHVREWDTKTFSQSNGGSDALYICPTCGACCTYDSASKHIEWHEGAK